MLKNQFYLTYINSRSTMELKDKYEVKIDFDEASKY